MVRGPYYQLLELRRYASAIGWRAALRLRLCDVMVRSGITRRRPFEIKPKNSSFPLSMRTHTSDRDALWQVFIHGEYEIAQLSNPRTIIDLGANVGYSAAYFLSKYPAATVLAVEPDAGNLEVCRRNLAPYGARAKLVHGAVWPERAKLDLDRGTFGDGRDWATRVRPASVQASSNTENQIDGFDVPTLIDFCECREVDLLKIDIERSELELFSRNAEKWLPRIKNLCIELHDAECSDVFVRAMSGYTYSVAERDGITVCLNLEQRSQLSS